MTLRYVGKRDSPRLVHGAFYDVKIYSEGENIIMEPVKCTQENKWKLIYSSPFTFSYEWKKG